MNKKEILKKCIYDNYLSFSSRYNDNQKAFRHTILAIKSILDDSSYSYFTRTNNIRGNLISTLPDPKECSNLLLADFIDILMDNPPQNPNEDPLYQAIFTTYYAHNKTQALTALQEAIEKNNFNYFSRYHNGDTTTNYRKLLMNSLSKESISNTIADVICNSVITEKENEQISNTINQKHGNQISNFKFYPSTFNQCREDILNGNQIAFQRRDYALGDLYASIDIGNVRKNQEDSVILLQHPNNPDFKMLVVADGMGGLDKGEQVSSFITSNITNWFENLDSEYFLPENINTLIQNLNMQIQKMNESIYNTYYGKAGSTFVGAIVTKNNTIISNVGDSRAYIYANGQLEQITEDDSVAFKEWQKGNIKHKDDIRFYKESNVITSGMGIADTVTPSNCVIPNYCYDTLLLFSDGVTDCLSDRDIMAITENTPKEELASTLVNIAKTKNSKQNHLDSNLYNSIIKPGKDNTTAAILDKRNNNSEGR